MHVPRGSCSRTVDAKHGSSVFHDGFLLHDTSDDSCPVHSTPRSPITGLKVHDRHIRSSIACQFPGLLYEMPAKHMESAAPFSACAKCCDRGMESSAAEPSRDRISCSRAKVSLEPAMLFLGTLEDPPPCRRKSHSKTVAGQM